MKTIQGNLLDTEAGIIAQQVNCQRVAAAGIALQFRNKWPGWYEAFKGISGVLGYVHYYPAEESLIIASLYAQDYYGRTGRYTDYDAFYRCLEDLAYNTRESEGKIYFPYRIGCGLAGGNWRIVSAMIEDVLPDAIIVRREK